MKKLVLVVLGLLVSLSCFAVTDSIADTSTTDKYNVWQGNDEGMAWQKNITRGQVRTVLIKVTNILDAKIETLDEILSKRIAETETTTKEALEAFNDTISKKLDDMDKKIAHASGQTNLVMAIVKDNGKTTKEDIVSLETQVSGLQSLLQKTRDQLAYLIRGTKEEIREKSKSSADEEYSRPFYVTTEIGSIGTNGNKLEAGYDYKIFDIDYTGTITPLVRYDNGLSFLVKGSVRWGHRN